MNKTAKAESSLEPKELTLKQQLFCGFYIKHRNATKAAKLAGYSEKTAYSYGQQLLKNLEIQEKINEGLELISQQAGISAEWVLDELKSNHHEAKRRYKVGESTKALKAIGEFIIPKNVHMEVTIPQPILSNTKDVHTNDSNKQGDDVGETPKMLTGGDECKQDNKHPAVSDPQGAVG